ncbi:MAG: hypothetical protein NXI32_22170 [bacterium]|nr:hypothetical protein [bacterium]
MNAKEITSKLLGGLFHHRHVVIPNVFILGSRWESDVVRITPAGFWIEYEIKISVADFRNDFQKTLKPSYAKNNQTKHDFLSSGDEYSRRWSSHAVPRPRQFYFVAPENLLPLREIPEHAGLIEVGGNRGWFQTVKEAPKIKNPTRLTQAQIYNLAAKVCQKTQFI